MIGWGINPGRGGRAHTHTHLTHVHTRTSRAHPHGTRVRPVLRRAMPLPWARVPLGYDGAPRYTPGSTFIFLVYTRKGGSIALN